MSSLGTVSYSACNNEMRFGGGPAHVTLLMDTQFHEDFSPCVNEMRFWENICL